MSDIDLNAYFSFSTTELLQIWRIEKLNPIKLPSPQPLFYKGDSYILLRKNAEQRTYTAHHWIGSTSSQDEYGAAAILVVKLASIVGQKVNIYQEWESNESVLFLSYFPTGVQYLDGGVDTAFNHVEPTKYKPRLLHIKGSRHIRVMQVALSGDSLNENDAFILDAGLELFLWVGTNANKQERAKSAFAATSIRNNERNGQAALRYPRDNAEDEKAFWSVLGGKPGSIKAEDDKKDEDIDQVLLSQDIHLYEVSNAEGGMSKNEITQRPLMKEMLKTEETYVLVLERDVYVWTGRKSNTEEKDTGIKLAEEYVQKLGKNKHVRCVRVFEGMEDIVFKMNFSNWSTSALRPSSTLMEASKEKKEVGLEVDFEQIHKRMQEAAYDSFGEITDKQLSISVIKDKELQAIPKADYGHFFDEESYVIDFQYKQNNKLFRVLYYWLGQRTTIERQTACAFHVAKLTQESKIRCSNVRVPMTKEPNEFFVHLFADTGLMLHDGRFEEQASYWTKHQDQVKLFHVNSSHVINTVAIEIEPKSSFLNSGDAFLLFSKDRVLIWTGKGIRKEENVLATKFANQFKLGRAVVPVSEGSEPEDFWGLLGGKADYPKVSKIEYATVEPRLFVLCDISGGLKAEEIRAFSQTDLVNDDVALLDAFYELFIWIGSGANENEKKLVHEAAKKYLESAKDGRNPNDCSVCSVYAGKETLNFTKYFKGWDWHLSELSDFKDPYLAMKEKYSKKNKEEEKKTEDVVQPVKEPAGSSEFLDPKTNKFQLAELQNNVPKGVNSQRRQDYLDDKTFEQVFKMKREEFEKLKDWKQRDLKKANKLF